MMNQSDPSAESQTLGFLKLWTESFARFGQAAFSFSPESAPPEMVRQIRSAMFQALSKCWDEYLRSPEFLEGMKATMDNALAFRKMSTDLLASARQQVGSVGREDVDALLVAVRHVENRVVERLETLSSQIVTLNERLSALENSKPLPVSNPPPKRSRAPRRRTAPQA